MTNDKEIVFVLGMHRSGTSALTRALAALGADLGDRLMKPIRGNNEKGFFEDTRFYELNERIQKRLGQDWDSLAALDPDCLAGPAFSKERREATRFLAERLATEHPFIAIKDPRASTLAPFWRIAAEDVGSEAIFLICVRHPLEVADSLSARDAMAPAKAVHLWAKHLIRAIGDTQGAPRAFARFRDFLDNPEDALDRLAARLAAAGVPIARDENETRSYCDQFVESRLYHHHVGDNELQRSGLAPPYILDLYQIANSYCEASGDSPLETDGDAWTRIVTAHREREALFSVIDDEIDVSRDRRIRLEALETEIVEMRETANQVGDARDEIARLKKAYDELRSRSDADYGRARERADREAQKYNTLAERVNQLKMQNQRLAEERDRVEAELSENAAQAEQDRQRAEAFANEQIAEKETLRVSNEQAKSAIAEVQRKLSDTEQKLALERSQAKERIAFLDSELAKLKSGREALRNSLSAAREEARKTRGAYLRAKSRRRNQRVGRLPFLGVNKR